MVRIRNWPKGGPPPGASLRELRAGERAHDPHGQAERERSTIALVSTGAGLMMLGVFLGAFVGLLVLQSILVMLVGFVVGVAGFVTLLAAGATRRG